MYTKKKGFITLMLVLGISSILLTQVVLSSASVFQYIHAKKEFDKTYQKSFTQVTCADTYIDFIVRGLRIQDMRFARQLFYGDDVICAVSAAHIVEVAPDVQILTFVANELYVRVEIRNGFVVSL